MFDRFSSKRLGDSSWSENSQRLRHHAAVTVAALLVVVASGAAIAQTGAPIVLGQTTSLTGPAGDFAKLVVEGMQASFDEANRSGGVSGRPIKLVTLDDAFDGPKALANAKKLVEEEKAIAIVGVNGAPATGAISGYLAEAQVPLIGSTQGAASLREFNPWRFYLRASYQDELRAMVRQIQSFNLSRVAVVYFDNPFGAEGNKSALALLNEAKVANAVGIAVGPTPQAIEAAAKKLFDAKPQATIFYSPVGPVSGVIKQFRALGGLSTFYGISIISGEALRATLGNDASGFVVAQLFPEGTRNGMQLVRACRSALAEKKLEYKGAAQLEGCIIAQATLTALKRTGGRFNGSALRQALEQGAMNLGGYELRFGPRIRDGSSYVDLGMVGKTGAIVR
jgi:branched-chain amino acid transport system substrate-binding protein